jgi:GNAT superfamily N-acetyltransferase
LNEPDLIELTEIHSEIAHQAFDLYAASFPPAERVPVEAIKDSILRREQNDQPSDITSHFLIAVREAKVLGLASYAYYGSTRLGFLFYLAVDPVLRGQGWGAWLLQKINARLSQDASAVAGPPPRGLMWEVERPLDAETPAEQEIRQRRIHFYQRNGAVLLDQIDFLAPPLAPGLPSVMYHVMFLPGQGLDEDLSFPPLLKDILDTILRHGYGIERESEYYVKALKLLSS